MTNAFSSVNLLHHAKKSKVEIDNSRVNKGVQKVLISLFDEKIKLLEIEKNVYHHLLPATPIPPLI